MTPKQKADELVERFSNVSIYISQEPKDIDSIIGDINSHTVKQCALICVDEIIKICPLETYDSYHVDDLSPEDVGLEFFSEFWQEVKTELLK